MTITSVKRRTDQTDIPEVTDLGPEPSLHYVDGKEQPLNVRPWYRYWVLSLAGISAFLVYSIISTPRIGGFDLGARQGGAGTAALLSACYAYAWFDDVHHTRETRPYWAERNTRGLVRMLVFSPVALLAAVAGITCAIKVGDTYASGLFIAPGVAALFTLVLTVDARKKRRRRHGR
jgi:hypothetical protein